MFINEYGNRNDPSVIMLAPMMISGSDLYDQMSQYFRGSYHFIAPDQGGHGKAGAYISAGEEYRTLKSFLLETGCTTIELVYGASLGVAVGYRLFMDSEFTVNHAWFDGVAFKSRTGIISASFFLIRCMPNECRHHPRLFEYPPYQGHSSRHRNNCLFCYIPSYDRVGFSNLQADRSPCVAWLRRGI